MNYYYRHARRPQRVAAPTSAVKDGLFSSPSAWLGLFFAAGVAQYLPGAFTSAGNEGEIYWKLSLDSMDASGPLKYVKDALLLYFSVFWALKIARKSRRKTFNIALVVTYWIFSLISIGTLGYLFDYNIYPPAFLAGLRWMLLLFDTIGLIFLYLNFPDRGRAQKFATNLILLMACADLAVLAKQGVSLGSSSLQGMRLPGAFAVAGTAGYFAVGATVIAREMRAAAALSRAALIISACLIGISSGTRFTEIAIGAICIDWLVEVSRKSKDPARRNKARLALLVSAPLITAGITAAITLADRGNPFDQGGEGGRIANLMMIAGSLSSASFVELLFGDGLGTATNSALAMVGTYPIARFHIMIDNTFATTFFQLGFVGTLYLILPIFAGLLKLRPFPYFYVLFILLATVTQNVFEQYFIMLSLPVGLTAAAVSVANTPARSKLGSLTTRGRCPDDYST